MSTSKNARSRSPYFILPLHLGDMTDDELDTFLVKVRERRLAAIRAYQEQERLKAEAAQTKLAAKVEKQFEMLSKECDALDRLIGKLEKRISNIQTLRIELGVKLL